MESSSEWVEIPINCSYGGFGYSKEFMEELKKRYESAGLSTTKLTDEPYSAKDRYDPIAIQLFKEKGEEWSSGPFAELGLRLAPAKYLDYCTISQYDGKEGLIFDYTRLFTDTVNNYLEESLTSLTHTLEELRAKVFDLEYMKKRYDEATNEYRNKKINQYTASVHS